jgi:Type III restriction enzyme, res subunit
MIAPELRSYQTDIVAKFHACLEAGKRRIILVAPTGSGKTIIGADIIRAFVRTTKSVMVLAHRLLPASVTESYKPAFSRGRWSWSRWQASRLYGLEPCTPDRWTCRRSICWRLMKLTIVLLARIAKSLKPIPMRSCLA